MFSYALRYGSLLFTFILLSGCATDGFFNANKSFGILGAYTLLAPTSHGETIIYARIIMEGNSVGCPILIGNKKKVVPTTARSLHPDHSNGMDTKNFPVTVCEAIIAPDTRYKDSSGKIDLRAITLNPSAIQVYGDTGCKSNVCLGNASAKKFQSLAEQGAKTLPELILHMGDYNYRGTSGPIKNSIYKDKKYAYDAGDGGYGGDSCGLQESYYSQNASGSESPDNWTDWNNDFFRPAEKILSSAPWVFARGNHELCSRAGPGWFYFFGPGSSLPGGVAQQQCPNQGDLATPPTTAAKHIQMIPPYFVKLKHLQLWVVDSANACDDRSSNTLTTQYQSWFNQLQKNIGKQNTWMVTHRPMWGVNQPGKDEAPLTKMLQTALKNSNGQALPPQVSLSLSGHMHLFQSITSIPPSKRPPQIIIGNSGVSLENITKENFSTTIDNETVNGNELRKHGFLQIDYQPDGSWEGKLFNKFGQTMSECGSLSKQRDQTVCELGKGLRLY